MPTVASKGAGLFVPTLFAGGKITNNMFSTNYDLSTGTSYIYFGGYETNMLSGNVTWIKLNTSKGFWDLTGTNI
jgi:hypothetical protein